jgi:hypothetical protein
MNLHAAREHYDIKIVHFLSFLKDGRQRSNNWYCSLQWVKVHAFYFNVLLAILSFSSPFLNKMLKIFFFSTHRLQRIWRYNHRFINILSLAKLALGCTGESTDLQEIVTGLRDTKSEISYIELNILSFPPRNDVRWLQMHVCCNITLHKTRNYDAFTLTTHI